MARRAVIDGVLRKQVDEEEALATVLFLASRTFTAPSSGFFGVEQEPEALAK
jgi:hypothetical protein